MMKAFSSALAACSRSRAVWGLARAAQARCVWACAHDVASPFASCSVPGLQNLTQVSSRALLRCGGTVQCTANPQFGAGMDQLAAYERWAKEEPTKPGQVVFSCRHAPLTPPPYTRLKFKSPLWCVLVRLGTVCLSWSEI